MPCRIPLPRVAHGRGQRCTWPWTTLHTAVHDVAHGRGQRRKPVAIMVSLLRETAQRICNSNCRMTREEKRKGSLSDTKEKDVLIHTERTGHPLLFGSQRDALYYLFHSLHGGSKDFILAVDGETAELSTHTGELGAVA